MAVFSASCAACPLWAQAVSISGIVTNQSGQPLPGVVVSLVSARLFDTTDAAGAYTLSGTPAQALPANHAAAESNSVIFRNNKLQITSAKTTTALVKLFDFHGETVAAIYEGRLSAGTTSIPLRLPRLGNQVYVMRITTESGSHAYKLMPLRDGWLATSGHSPHYDAGSLHKSLATDWLQAIKPCYASHFEQITALTGQKDFSMSTSSSAPDFGPNTYIFDPSMTNIQSQVTNIYNQQQGAQFGNGRFACLFKPGSYNVSILVGFYTEILGLGLTPDSVQITGAVESDAYLSGGNATCNFWRSCAGIAVTPTGGSDRWSTSQACPIRRMHIKGNLGLTDGCSTCWGSGGFLADSKIDGTVNPYAQQQWISRNCEWGSWGANIGSWNLVFCGCTNLPTNGTWPSQPYTFINKTPVIAEKPFLVFNNCGYSVFVPDLHADSTIGTSWSTGKQAGTMLPIDLFYIAKSSSDNATTLNAALAQGKNLLITPGIYHLNQTLQVSRPGTVVLGIGIPSLVPDNGTPAMKAADVDGVKIAGILFEANATNSPTLLQVGDSGSTVDHSKNPTCLYDIFCRAGGAFAGSTNSMVTINSNNVIFDHNWLWRADHGNGVGWTSNKCGSGLVVNGNNVTCYGLLVEHNQQFQTYWNGNGGRMFMYQSELPYDPPNQAGWMDGTQNGYPTYKVANTVTTHEAQGLGAYSVFQNSVTEFNAMEAPNAPGIKMTHMLILFLGGSGSITHVISGTGNGQSGFGAQRVTTYP